MRYLLLSSVILLLVTTSGAQSKFSFYSQNYVGLLKGQQGGSSLLVQSINGVQKKGWFAGLGIGMDFYRIRSIPLFLNASKFLFAKQQFFVSGNGGINLYWRDKMDVFNSNKHPPQFSGEAGFGYLLKDPDDKKRFILSMGYSYKHIREETSRTDNVERNDWRFHRLVAKFGLLF